MTYINSFLLVFMLLFMGCDKDNNSNKGADTVFCNTQEPLEDLEWLNDIVQSSLENQNNKTEIYKCKYNNEEGFLINTCVDCVDSYTTFNNCSGDIICQFGGVLNLNDCPDFWDNISEKELLWKHPQ